MIMPMAFICDLEHDENSSRGKQIPRFQPLDHGPMELGTRGPGPFIEV